MKSSNLMGRDVTERMYVGKHPDHLYSLVKKLSGKMLEYKGSGKIIGYMELRTTVGARIWVEETPVYMRNMWL